jgi:hypothetical protein
MNAALVLIQHLHRDAQRRLARSAGADLRAQTIAQGFDLDLCGLLNRLRASELAELAHAVEVARDPARDDVGSLREALWRWGARLEARGDHLVGTSLQPTPVRLGARLVHVAPARGLAPPADAWPRPLPPPSEWVGPDREPDDVDELLAAADRALGVRLPARGRDKGAWGAAAARLLGVVERGVGEPDWRGDVEIKTVPVAQDRAGHWRVTEDPAVAMVDASPLAKLRRVLWLVRANCDGGATLLSWYFVEWDAEVARLVRRDLHTRPKGPRGTSARGWYLHKRFFIDAGLYPTLNGPAMGPAMVSQ